jgi:hypothetical protein
LHRNLMSAMPPALPRIPAPFRRRWRELRIRLVPAVVFVLVAVVAVGLWFEVVAPRPCGNGTNGWIEGGQSADAEEECRVEQAFGSSRLMTNSVLDPDAHRD